MPRRDSRSRSRSYDGYRYRSRRDDDDREYSRRSSPVSSPYRSQYRSRSRTRSRSRSRSRLRSRSPTAGLRSKPYHASKEPHGSTIGSYPAQHGRPAAVPRFVLHSRLPGAIKCEIEDAFAAGRFTVGDILVSNVQGLEEMPPDLAMQAVREYSRTDRTRIKHPAAYFSGMMKRICMQAGVPVPPGFAEPPHSARAGASDPGGTQRFKTSAHEDPLDVEMRDPHYAERGYSRRPPMYSEPGYATAPPLRHSSRDYGYDISDQQRKAAASNRSDYDQHHSRLDTYGDHVRGPRYSAEGGMPDYDHRYASQTHPLRHDVPGLYRQRSEPADYYPPRDYQDLHVREYDEDRRGARRGRSPVAQPGTACSDYPPRHAFEPFNTSHEHHSGRWPSPPSRVPASTYSTYHKPSVHSRNSPPHSSWQSGSLSKHGGSPTNQGVLRGLPSVRGRAPAASREVDLATAWPDGPSPRAPIALVSPKYAALKAKENVAGAAVADTQPGTGQSSKAVKSVIMQTGNTPGQQEQQAEHDRNNMQHDNGNGTNGSSLGVKHSRKEPIETDAALVGDMPAINVMEAKEDEITAEMQQLENDGLSSGNIQRSLVE